MRRLMCTCALIKSSWTSTTGWSWGHGQLQIRMLPHKSSSTQHCFLTSQPISFQGSRWTHQRLPWVTVEPVYRSFKSDHSGLISAQLHLSLYASLGFVSLLFFSSCYLQVVFWDQIFSFCGSSYYAIYKVLALTFSELYTKPFVVCHVPIPPYSV